MSSSEKPFAPSCERNKEAIGDALAPWLDSEPRRLVEIGSGTGQHAVYLAERFANTTWQCTDVIDNLAGIGLWLDEAALPNLPPPLALDVQQSPWPTLNPDLVFSANTAHIMDWAAVQLMFRGVAKWFAGGESLLLYGPFNVDGQFTSDGNRQLDQWARDTFPGGGLRDKAQIFELAESLGCQSGQSIAMPANNWLLALTW